MDSKDYLEVLQAIKEIPFGVGRELLSCFLRGSHHNSIEKNRLYQLSSYASLSYSKEEISALISLLLTSGFIRYEKISYYNVISLTQKGRDELQNPSFHSSSVSKFTFKKTQITSKDEKEFEKYPYLSRFDKYQKKAILCDDNKVLCIAGPGSGKTTVLTHKISFLVKEKKVDPQKILAITFTRKAKQEMSKRLLKLGVKTNVFTFNGFCDSLLKNKSIATGKQKASLVSKALKRLGLTPSEALSIYYEDKQLSFFDFVFDVFYFRDFSVRKSLTTDFEVIRPKVINTISELLAGLVFEINVLMKEEDLIDYVDQVRLALDLEMPSFDYVLVDEYQDVNDMQVKLLAKLDPQKIFVVGDPRQSIYGWRGSNPDQLVRFSEGASVISLVYNYRSSKDIVELSNKLIKSLFMPNMVSFNDWKKDIKILGFESFDVEKEFVVQRILSSGLKPEDIFVLTRKNKDAQDFFEYLTLRGIPCYFKSGEEVQREKVTISTVHGVKGLEAQMVFVVGVNSFNYPCRVPDHPITKLLDDYDTLKEELRLLYVAITRAEKSLYITYAGTHSFFITQEMKDFVNDDNPSLHRRLLAWRKEKALQESVPEEQVLTSSLIEKIAQINPVDEYDLQDSGIGPTKIFKYGEEILSLVNK